MRRSGQRDLGQKLKADDKERDKSRDRVEFFVRHADEDEEILREARERYQSQGQGQVRYE